MADFKSIAPMELEGKLIQMIAHQWPLLSAAKDGKANTMTVSWGGIGHLWNVPVATVYVRDHRYTYQFTEAADGFSLCFFGEEYREQLTYCGTVSGRDEDKIAHCGFCTLYKDGVPYFAQAQLVLICKKLYAQDMAAECALSPIVTKQYPENDYHRMYIGQITDVLVK